MAKLSSELTKQSYDPAGNLVTTNLNDDGSVKSTFTQVTNPDGSTTTTEKLANGAVKSIVDKDGSGKTTRRIYANDNGTIQVTGAAQADGTYQTTTLSGDGKTTLSSVVKHPDSSETTTYYNPDGTVKGAPVTKSWDQIAAESKATTQANFDAAQASGQNPLGTPYNNTLTDVWKNDIQSTVDGVKAGVKDVKGLADATNPLGTPGLDNAVITDKLLGGPNAGGSIYSKDALGSVLHGIATAYGLGGLGTGSGTGGTGAGSGAGGTNGSGIDTSPIAAAAAASKALQDKFLADYNAAHPGQPPVMTAAQLPPAVLATMPEAIRPGVADAIGNITAGHADATLLDPTLQAQQRDKQLGLEGTIQDAIDGKAPSVAQLQLQAALQTNEANQLGLASKASGGGNVALALRTAANNTARLNQGASSDAAILRAKEIADARAQLGGVLDQTRGSDISLADKNASLATDVSKTNATLDTNTSMKDAELEAARRAGNATNETTARSKDAEIQAQIAAANAKAQNDAAAKQGDLNQGAAANNQTAAISQEQIDALARQNAAKNAIDAGGQVITGTVGAADAQAKAVAAAQAAKAAQDAKDAAGLGALGTLASKWLTSGSSSGGTATGSSGAPILD